MEYLRADSQSIFGEADFSYNRTVSNGELTRQPQTVVGSQPEIRSVSGVLRAFLCATIVEAPRNGNIPLPSLATAIVANGLNELLCTRESALARFV